MQDEHFQRDWAQSHDRFVQGVDAGLEKLGRALTGTATPSGSALRRKADATTKAVLAGLILGATVGGVLVSTQATPRTQNSVAEPASVRLTLTRTALA